MSTSPVTHEAIDKMTVDQLKSLLVDTWKLGTKTQLRTTRRPDLARQAHAYLSLADAKGTDAPFPTEPDEPPAEPTTPPAPTSPDYPSAPEQPDVADQPADEPGVELEVAPESTVPSQSRWQQIMDIAETVAMANLAPKDLRGHGNIGNARLVLLAAHDLGIPITQAIQKLAPVNGRLVMSAELMAALIRRDGHRLSVPASDWSGCTVVGVRADTGEEMTVTFDLDDAETAQLIEHDRKDNGRPKARSSDGKPLPWELYPSDLCYARALSRLGRRLFPDCLGGISYTAEELGDTGEYDPGASFGAPAAGSARPEATQTIEEQRAALGVRIAALPEGLQATLKDEWKRRNLPTLKSAPVGVIRTIRNLVEQAEKEAEPPPDTATDSDVGDDGQPIDEAEVVEDAEQQERDFTEAHHTATRPDTEPEPPVCDSCTLPIAPGLADDGTGSLVTQPVDSDGKQYHATCAPF